MAPPPYQSLRYDEDYRYLGDPAQRSDALDFLKFVPLSVAGGAYVSLGGEVRLRYEHFDHTLWGQGPQDRDGYLLLRTMLHADVRFTRRLRFFSQLKSGVEEGRTGGPRPTDEDRLDLHQAFFELATGSQGAPSLSLRVGRQEVAFGSSRLVSFREGPNVRQSFDGVRGTIREGTWQVDALALAPVQTASGSFDDRPDPRQKLW
ncbi:MAG: alginate export family protein, partial [Verrucomicrobia bacterium]|nr:alginate export family protein [Verrucomicrobiota bacterium]